jgi:hypothetical protein
MMRHALSRLLIGAALLAGCTALPLAPASAVAQQAKPEYPKIRIPNPSPAIPGSYGPKGSEALRILDPYMSAVTAWYGLSKEDISYSFLRPRNDFTDRDRTDRGEWRLDNDGRIVIVEKFRPFDFSPDTRLPPGPSTISPLFPLEITETLHSNPNAKISIWVSLRGDTTSTSSNLPLASTASPDDQAKLQHIWQRLAENFAPFDVDVTTEKPSDADLQRSGPDDNRYGYQVIIDRSTTPGENYPRYLEGLVYLNSFDDLDPQRRIITLKWPDSYPSSSYTPDMAAHMIAHMLGHSLGLRDEDFGGATIYSAAGSYAGHRSPIGSWAPIMGRPGNARRTHFSRGEFPGALNQTDSIARIAEILPLRSDDAGDTIQTATKLPMQQSLSGSTAKGSVTGIIGKQADIDVYAIDATKRVIRAELGSPWQLTSGGASSNIVPDLTLLDEKGDVLERGSGRGLDFTVPRPGRYYLQVRSTGIDSDYSRVGFSDYGSLGHYTLNISNEIQYPLAHFTFTPVSGVAPLTVTFDASSTRHERPLRYNWLFGDGTPAEFGPPRITHTFTKPGFYWVAVRVVDDEGRTGGSMRGIVVREMNEITAKVDLGLIATSSTSSAAYGRLYAVDGNGKPLPNAMVRYNWFGLQQGQRSLVSREQGSLVMSLPSNKSGCFGIEVTGITLAGYTFNTDRRVVASACR